MNTIQIYNLFTVERWHGVNKVFDTGMGILAFLADFSFFHHNSCLQKVTDLVNSVQTDLVLLQVVKGFQLFPMTVFLMRTCHFKSL